LGAKVDWRGEEFMAAVKKATKESIRDAAKLIAKQARQDAPRAAKHRTKRKYPGGSVITGEQPTYKSITFKVKDRKDRGILGYVKTKTGYPVWGERGWELKTKTGRVVRKIPGKFWMRNALEKNKEKLIPILKGRMPK